MLPLLKQSLELNCVRANSICYLVLIKFWKNWAEKGACSVVVMATTVFQKFSCPLYWLNFGVGILSNILQIKVIFHKRKQHVHHSSKYLFRHAHEVCKAWEHGTEGSQHIKSSGEEGGGISFFHSLSLPLNFYFLKSCTIARLPVGSILFLAKSRTEKVFTQKAQKLWKQ